MDWTAIAIILAAVIPAIFNFIREKKLDRIKDKLEIVHQDVNGKIAELLKVTAEAEKAKGVLEGKKSKDAT